MGIFVFMNELQRDMTPEVRCSAVECVCLFHTASCFSGTAAFLYLFQFFLVCGPECSMINICQTGSLICTMYNVRRDLAALKFLMDIFT